MTHSGDSITLDSNRLRAWHAFIHGDDVGVMKNKGRPGGETGFSKRFFISGDLTENGGGEQEEREKEEWFGTRFEKYHFRLPG